MRFAILSAAVFLGAISACDASVVSGVITGTIGGQGPTYLTEDTFGLFGAAGASLYGELFLGLFVHPR
jgi:hypothetical protein